MTFTKHSLSAPVLAMTLAMGLAPLPGLAASSTASSASESLTTSVGSVSNSLTGASGSSKTAVAAAGDYQLIQIAAADNRPGVVQLTLRPLGRQGVQGTPEDIVLSLPQKAFDNSGLAQGDTVAARERAYGVEFANAQTRAAFFLVMSDASYRELASHPVAL
jgi:hypothetical protein